MFSRIGEVNRIYTFKKGMPCQVDLANNGLNKAVTFIAGLFRAFNRLISINLQGGN